MIKDIKAATTEKTEKLCPMQCTNYALSTQIAVTCHWIKNQVLWYRPQQVCTVLEVEKNR